jgi:hypothetical protein
MVLLADVAWVPHLYAWCVPAFVILPPADPLQTVVFIRHAKPCQENGNKVAK